MLLDSQLVPETIVRPNSFVGLMALYESNYLRLLRLIPDIRQLDGCFISRVAGDCDLYAEGFDPVKATHRLALYWKHRKAVFGDRWLLPMTQTGTGALTRKAAEIVQSGFMALMSPTPVCVMDTSRLSRPLDNELAACIFYFGTINNICKG